MQTVNKTESLTTWKPVYIVYAFVYVLYVYAVLCTHICVYIYIHIFTFVYMYIYIGRIQLIRASQHNYRQPQVYSIGDSAI